MNKNSISTNSNLLLIGVTRVSANNGLSDEFLLHNTLLIIHVRSFYSVLRSTRIMFYFLTHYVVNVLQNDDNITQRLITRTLAAVDLFPSSPAFEDVCRFKLTFERVDVVWVGSNFGDRRFPIAAPPTMYTMGVNLGNQHWDSETAKRVA